MVAMDLLNGIKKAGYNPEDITDVLLTHLHADHCGGGVKKKYKDRVLSLLFQMPITGSAEGNGSGLLILI